VIQEAIFKKARPVMTFANWTPKSNLNDVEQEVATAIAKVAYFVSPKVVQRITELNCTWRAEFKANFGSRLDDVSAYFYSDSACVFPGVRRPSTEAERKLKKFRYDETAKAILDDNSFPRQVWSFLCTGKKHSHGGQHWKKSGLGRFELAHVLPQKRGNSQTPELTDASTSAPILILGVSPRATCHWWSEVPPSGGN
jgi:hypothetical protein